MSALVWQQDLAHVVAVNDTIAHQAAWEWWYPIQKLLGANLGAGGETVFTSGLWTCKGSSNSVAAGMDATNRLAAYTNIVCASESSPHSWIVLQQSTIGIEVCLSWNSPTVTNVSIKWAKASGGGFTGGSTTASPTDPTNVESYGSVGAAYVSAVGAFHVECSLATTGEFFFTVSRDTTSLVSTFFGIMGLAEAHPSDVFPYISVFHYIETGALAASVLASNSNTVIRARKWDDSGSHSGAGGIGMLKLSTTPLFDVAGTALLGATDAAEAVTPDFPAYYVAGAVGAGTIKGSIKDMRLVAPAGYGAMSPTTTGSTNVVIGGFQLPRIVSPKVALLY